MKSWQRAARITLATALFCGLGTAGSSFSTTAQAAPTVRQDGPHAPLGRHPAPTTVTRSDNVAVSHYDLGDVEVGNTPGAYRAPMRGSLITPVSSSGRSKLIIISHLRSAGCAHEVFAFPCPGAEVRLDRGMEYLGKALAAQGYAVLIPDVAPVWIGTTLKVPYDQTSAWLKVVGGTRDFLADDVAGSSQHFGLPLTSRIDMSEAGLLVHSRSALIAGPAINAWRHGPTPITSVLAYGPAYDVPDVYGHVSPPIAADVPYLGLVGSVDHDVAFNGNLWLAENIEQRRSAAALIVTVPTLGHNYINQTLSGAHIDDRINCTVSSCAPASTHERFLTTVTENYFDATLRHRPTTLPLSPTADFPRTLGGLPALWLGVTNSPQRVTILNADIGRRPQVSHGSSIQRCRFYDPQDFYHHSDSCPETDRGNIIMVSSVFRAKLAQHGSLTISTHLTQTQALELQITPYGDRLDHSPVSPLQVTITLAGGQKVNVPVPASALDVLKGRATADTNGIYPLTTMRLPLPANLRHATITGLTLTAPQGGTYAIRAIDAIADGSASSSTPAPSGQPGSSRVPSRPVTSSPVPSHQTRPTPVHGPLVQTDDVRR